MSRLLGTSSGSAAAAARCRATSRWWVTAGQAPETPPPGSPRFGIDRRPAYTDCPLLNMHLTCDYHTHPQAHVLQLYTPDLLQPWIERARQTGIQSLAFTDHDRYHAGIDFDVVERLREANPDVDLLLGIELDNDPVTSGAGLQWVERHWDKLDFVLGSVHYLPGAATMFDRTDQTAQLTTHFGLEQAFSLYLDELDKLLRRGLIDCLAHLDLIKIHRLYPPDYDDARWFQPTLAKVAASGLAMEASTAGWRKTVAEQYPSAAILALARQMGVPITTASDAHAPAQLCSDYNRLETTLDNAGIQTTVRFRKHKKTNINEHQPPGGALDDIDANGQDAFTGLRS